MTTDPESDNSNFLGKTVSNRQINFMARSSSAIVARGRRRRRRNKKSEGRPRLLAYG
jgi:hypothetical protein